MTQAISETAGAPARRERREPRSSVVRTLATFRRSLSGAAGLRIDQLPAGPLPDDLLHRIREFEHRIATIDAVGTPTICDQGRDYTAYWRTAGRGVHLFTATDADGRIVGVAAAMGMRLVMPTGRVRRATYLGHFRVLPECRFGSTVGMLGARMALASALQGWTAFGVVLNHTSFTPQRVASSIGIGAYRAIGTQRLVYFPTDAAEPGDRAGVREVTEAEVRRAYADFTRGMIRASGGNPHARSLRPPRWIMSADGNACACIEDSERLRRWHGADGAPVRMSTLTFFGWRDPRSAAAIVRGAMTIVASEGVPRVRALLDISMAEQVAPHVGVPPSVVHDFQLNAASPWGLPRAPWSLHPTEL